MSECTECEVTEISIHALRGEGDNARILRKYTQCISIHALRGEGDFTTEELPETERRISIHALRGEGDIRVQCNLI